MSHFWNDSLMNLSEPKLDICALSHQSVENIQFVDIPIWISEWTNDILIDHLFLNVLKDYKNCNLLIDLSSCFMTNDLIFLFLIPLSSPPHFSCHPSQ